MGGSTYGGEGGSTSREWNCLFWGSVGRSSGGIPAPPPRTGGLPPLLMAATTPQKHFRSPGTTGP
jgi:hypothetical protein